jgi:hypothetical protein
MKIHTLIFILHCIAASSGFAQDNQEKIAALINELAVEGVVQGRPNPDPYKAAWQLRKFGAEALPLLAKGLSDKRGSAPFLRVRDQTVGVACKSIIIDMIYALPDSYPGSFYRKNVDGELSERPVFFKHIWGSIGEDEKLVRWLEDRKKKTLKEIQIECLTWALGIEKQIGAVDGEERANYLDPLEKRLDQLRKEAEQE